MEDKRNKRQSRLEETGDNSGDARSSDNGDETCDNSGDARSSDNGDETVDNSGDASSSDNGDETDDNSDDARSSDNGDETDDNSGDASSSDNGDETVDNSGDASSSDTDDETDDTVLNTEDSNINTIKSKFSIFKLANNRLAGLGNIQADIKSFGKYIEQKLIEAKMQCKGCIGDTCRTFNLMYFFHSTGEKNDATAAQITKHRKYEKGTGNFPGDRRSGNILVFYRFKKKTQNTENSIPEAFFLCQGSAYHFILPFSDPSFRTRVVKRFMDGGKIKEIETLNIAGSDVTSKITYKDNCNIATVSFLEQAIVGLSGIIVKNSKLDQLIQQDGEKKTILMEVGINFVRICKSFTCEKWANVLELFSDEVGDEETEVDGPTRHIRDALECVRRVEEDKKSLKLDENIAKKAIYIIANNRPTSSYYLSHRYTRDWSLSSNVILSEKHTESTSCDKITFWNSAPTFIMVIEAINRHFKLASLIEESLRNRKIVLSYGREKKMKKIPVQDFVHGSVSQDGGQYFKIAQKWFFLSSTYSQVVDRNFAYICKYNLVDKRISDLMKYPWRTHKLEITIPDCEKFLGVSHDEGKQILLKLTQKCTLVQTVDTSKHCCLTDHSYLLPQSSQLHKELAEKHQVDRILHKVLTSDRKINDNSVQLVLRKKKQTICVQEDKYFVCNPILTKNMMKQINIIRSSLEEPILSIFLRCMSLLSEGDYNALYLNSEENNKFIIFPGDKILANNVELFDILVYDKENHTTYLFHNKKGLDHHTRDACAQIRNASELLWHDFMRGQLNHIELFWESAVNSTTAETPYRYFLKCRLEKLGKNNFMKMFDKDTKIVFVLGFVLSAPNASPKLQWPFKPLTLEDFLEKDLSEHDKTWLEEKDILTKSGYLTDCFIGMTKTRFAEKYKSSVMNFSKLNEIYALLRTKGTCELSTIAKLELLTLNNCFSRYQIGGKSHYSLKLLQLDSK